MLEDRKSTVEDHQDLAVGVKSSSENRVGRRSSDRDTSPKSLPKDWNLGWVPGWDGSQTWTRTRHPDWGMVSNT